MFLLRNKKIIFELSSLPPLIGSSGGKYIEDLLPHPQKVYTVLIIEECSMYIVYISFSVF